MASTLKMNIDKYETIFTIIDVKKEIGLKQFGTNDYQHGKDYTKKSKMAHNLQAEVCKYLGITNNGKKIGVHINLLNDIPKNKVLFK